MKRAWMNIMMMKFNDARVDAHKSLEYHSDPAVMWNSFEILGHCYAKKGEVGFAETFLKEALNGLRESNVDNAMKATSAGRITKVLKVVKTPPIEPLLDENVQDLIKPRISYGKNTILKCATEAVEVKEEEETGKGIYATKEIKPGLFFRDHLIREKTFNHLSQLSYIINKLFKFHIINLRILIFFKVFFIEIQET